MQGDKAIIRLLNAVLTNELTAVNQYFLHARIYENWGLNRLGKVTYDDLRVAHQFSPVTGRIVKIEAQPGQQEFDKDAKLIGFVP